MLRRLSAHMVGRGTYLDCLETRASPAAPIAQKLLQALAPGCDS